MPQNALALPHGGTPYGQAILGRCVFSTVISDHPWVTVVGAYQRASQARGGASGPGGTGHRIQFATDGSVADEHVSVRRRALSGKGDNQ